MNFFDLIHFGNVFPKSGFNSSNNDYKMSFFTSIDTEGRLPGIAEFNANKNSLFV